MKIKYMLERVAETEKLKIREFGELDKDIMAVLCEVSYDDADIIDAIDDGMAYLISEIRSDSLYPPVSHIGKIAEQIIAMYGPDGKQSVDLLFDDKELLMQEQADEDELADLKEDVDIAEPDEPDELDELLNDDVIDIQSKATKIKIADDDSVDVDEEG